MTPPASAKRERTSSMSLVPPPKHSFNMTPAPAKRGRTSMSLRPPPTHSFNMAPAPAKRGRTSMSLVPPPKRPRKMHRGEDDYRPGSIVEIEAHNFMTYSHLKARPGPRLNLVIGANGTGKSSLVCAVGIGLAGEPQLLGRGGQIGDFVKRGEESGWIKISLRGDSPDEVLVIKRNISKRNKSGWFCNDQAVTKRDIQERVRKYNIQLDNLTQFLPQDRVCEFAKLSPIQLLEETEKAVGNPKLSAQHRRLIQRNEERKKIQISLSSHESSLAHVKASNAELEEDKQRMHQRAQLLEKAEIMKKKVPWLKYEEKKASLEHAEQAQRVAKSMLQNFLRSSREIESSFEPLRARQHKVKEASERMRDAKLQIEQKVSQVAEQETVLSTKRGAKFVEIQEVHREDARLQKRIETAEKGVIDAEAHLGKLPKFVPPKEILKTLKDQVTELHIEEADKRSQVQEKESLLLRRRHDCDQCNRRLQDINSVKTRLLQALKNSGVLQIVNAYEWVQSHREQFRSEVFGPVLLEVRIDNKDHAKYVENHVPGHIWGAFITQDDYDRDLLVRNLKQFWVPVINQRKGQSRHPPRVVDFAMMQLGITTRLDEVIVAPDVVKTLLIGQANLDKSFIGTSETNRRADEAPRLGVRDLWTPENHYRWSESRYGGHVSASVNPVRPVRLFSKNVDLREKNELANRKAQLEDEMSQLEVAIREFNVELKAMSEEISNLERQKNEISHQARQQRKREEEATNNLEMRRRNLSMLKRGESSADAERRLLADIKQINAERVQNLISLTECLTEAGEVHMCYAAQHLHVIELDAKVKDMEKNVQKQDLAVRDAKGAFRKCQEATETCRSQLADAAQSAGLTRDLQARFAELPDSIDELDIAINEHEAQAAAVICNNENAILIYEQRCEAIRILTIMAEEKRTALDSCLKEIERIQGLWLPQLRSLVSNINETFSQNFMEMAVAGEVSLDEHGMHFDQYGILIKVKFRESGRLQALSAQHQSGGERSVSTILYLVALQDLTYCPFRVVDEINQGMDPENERKTFQQLVRAASQPKTPQCLLLTPKLLSNLTYTDSISILNIMNGPWVESASTSGWKDGLTWGAMSQLTVKQ